MKRICFCFLYAVFLLCSMFLMFSCSDNDSNGNDGEDKKYTGIPLIILDNDIGSSTDDLFAMQMAYMYHRKGLCRLLGVVVNREGEDYAACADVMNTYYGFGFLPLGLERDGVKNPRVFNDYRKLAEVKTSDGQLMFKTTIKDYSSIPDGCTVYRRLLAAQPDHSVSICSIGFCTNLAHLIKTEGDEVSPLSGLQLIRKKVKCLYIMGGVFTSSDEPDYNFVMSGQSVRDLFALWPIDVEVVFSPMEVGNAIEYLKEDVLADLSWADSHPIKYVYENIYNVNGGQKMWDPLTLIQAVEGDEEFILSERGVVTLSSEAATILSLLPRDIAAIRSLARMSGI